jgi:hypothetical protein
MRKRIKVDNSRPLTGRQTATILGVSKKRTEQLIRAVRRMIFRDPKTGRVVVRTGATVKGSPRDASKKAHKPESRRVRAAR